MNPLGRSAVLLVVVLAIGAAIYAAAGVANAYLAADDFQWLSIGHAFTWSGLLRVGGDRFYRPVVEVWFAGAVAACGPATSCYHLLNLALHLFTISLVFAMALALFRDARAAFWGALFFAVEPAYTQAVVWISAVSTLLATCLYVASLLAQAGSWRAATEARRRAAEAVAVLAAAGAMFSHEAAITLPVVSWLMWREFGPESLTKRRTLAAGLAIAAGVFALATVLANYRNPAFSEAQYAIGAHAVRSGLGYIVSLYVGPSWWAAWVVGGVVMAVLLAAAPATRFGALWLLVTVVPYTGFRWGNVSRYEYLPSIGFALAVAAALCAGADRLARRGDRSRRIAVAAVFLVATFVAVRFVRFDYPSITSQVQSLEPWRAYAERLAAEAPQQVAGRVVEIGPSFASEFVDPMYVGPMLRWLRHDFTLQIIIDRPWTARR